MGYLVNKDKTLDVRLPLNAALRISRSGSLSPHNILTLGRTYLHRCICIVIMEEWFFDLDWMVSNFFFNLIDNIMWNILELKIYGKKQITEKMTKVSINTNLFCFDGNIQTFFLTVFFGTVLPKEGLLQNLNENIFVHNL